VEVKYAWEKQKIDNSSVKNLANQLNVSEVIARILVGRGVTSFETAQNYFRPSWGDFHDGLLMKNMRISIERLNLAIQEKQHVLVYGDYDVDGTCSVAMMTNFLRQLSSNVSFYQPHREKEGYGISLLSVQWMTDHKVDLVIALDCGIKDFKSATAIKSLNIDLIICDHHTPSEELPSAFAILNPKQADCGYPFKELCGCGVGFKLIQSYEDRYKVNVDITPLLQLAAVATTADVVPLVDENRLITFFGLSEINSNPMKALHNLFISAKKNGEITASDLVFKIAPRINAAGRLSTAMKATELLLSDDDNLNPLTKEIESVNSQRRLMDEKITLEALSQLDKQPNERVTNLVYSPNWHKGVVGIVASRIMEHSYKPTIVMTGSDNVITGSARSVKGFNIYDVLQKLQHYFIRFGGHKYAAGLSIDKKNLNSFFIDFEKEVKATIQSEMLVPTIKIDSELTFSDLIHDQQSSPYPKIYRIIKQMEPFGPGNSKPVFLFKGIKNAIKPRIVGEKHIKFCFSDSNNSFQIDGIWFNSASNFQKILKKNKIDVVATLNQNFFNGIYSLQLMIKDVN